MNKTAKTSFCLCLILLAAIFVLGLRAPEGTRAIAVKTPTAGVTSVFPPPESMNSSRSKLPQILEGYGGLPLNFEANQGQTDPNVKFISRGNGYSVYLTSTEAVLELSGGAYGDHSRIPGIGLQHEVVEHQGKVKHALKQTRRDRGNDAVLGIQLLGANSAASPVGSDQLPGKVNYILGNDPSKWRTGVPMFAKVRYENVYPGVDLVYHGDHRQLEYDFIVSPGAEPDLIRMSLDGAVGEKEAVVPQVDNEGNLILKTSAGNVAMHLPFVYQQTGKERQKVACQYRLLGKHVVGFKVGEYDRSKPLIIDPVVIYSTYLGGSVDDFPTSIVVDASGSAYLTGSTDSPDFPNTSGAFQSVLKGTESIFITKLSPDGKSLIYSTYLGGSGTDFGIGIAVDAGGNAYVTGQTNSTDFPTTSGAFQTVRKNSAGNAFVAKLAPDGKSLIYSTYLGGSGDTANDADTGFSIAVDLAGNAYVAGGTGSADFPTTSGAFQTVAKGNVDAFVTKLAPDGKSLAYSTFLGGSNADDAFAIAVDSAQSAYVSGATLSPNFPTTPGVFQSTSLSGETAFVSKLAPDGKSLVYSTFLGGTGVNDENGGNGIAVDSTFNAYVTGFTDSATFPTKNAFQGLYGGGPDDVFLTKFNPGATALLYSTFLGGPQNDAGLGLALDPTASGKVFLTGRGDSGTFPVVNAVQSVCGGCQHAGPDAFVARIDTTQSGASSLLFSSFLGGTAQDVGNAVAADGSGNVYVAGSTSGEFPITPGAVQVSPAGGEEAFVVKIAPNSASGFTLSDVNLNFGTQALNTNTPLNVVLGNAGTSTLNISNVMLTGTNSAEFSQSNTCGASVAPGARCTVTVAFFPASVGPKSATITFTDDAAGSPQALNLSGAGTIPVIALSVSPTSLSFGSAFVGSTTPSQEVALKTTGNVPITLTSIIFNGANTGDFILNINSSCQLSPASLPPGSTCLLDVSFKPTAAGNRTASMIITDNAPDSPQTVALTGTGTIAPDFTMAASPSSATVTAGQSTSYTLTLTPVGGFTGTISLGCSGAPSLASCTVPASITISGANPVTATANVLTTARTIVPPGNILRNLPRDLVRDWWPILLLFMTTAALAIKPGSRVNHRLAHLRFALVLLVAILCAAGCGSSAGGGGNPGTPAGNYTLTFSGNSVGFSHTATAALTVN